MTVILYLILIFCGWVSIYAASYDFDNASISILPSGRASSSCG